MDISLTPSAVIECSALCFHGEFMSRVGEEELAKLPVSKKNCARSMSMVSLGSR
jgi:hypothetical protein